MTCKLHETEVAALAGCTGKSTETVIARYGYNYEHSRKVKACPACARLWRKEVTIEALAAAAGVPDWRHVKAAIVNGLPTITDNGAIIAELKAALKAVGVGVDHDDSGWQFFGNTYPVKDALKSGGCKWSANEKSWYAQTGTLDPVAILARLK